MREIDWKKESMKMTQKSEITKRMLFLAKVNESIDTLRTMHIQANCDGFAIQCGSYKRDWILIRRDMFNEHLYR